MPLTIRRATPADAPTIVEFNRRLAEETEGKTLDPAVLAAGVAAGLADPDKAPLLRRRGGGDVLGPADDHLRVERLAQRLVSGGFRAFTCGPRPAGAASSGRCTSTSRQTAAGDPTVIGLRLYVERENQAAHQTYLRMGMEWTSYLMLEKYPLEKPE